MGIIYLITNKINNKKYVGLDSFKHSSRWKDHIKYSKRDNPIQLIDRKIKQYGIENFSYQVLYECETLEELNQKEIEYIKFYDCYVGTGKGYNLTLGGGGIGGFKIPLDKIKRGINHHRYGKHWSESEKLKRSVANKGKLAGDKNPFKKPEVRKVLSEIAKKRVGKLNPNYKHGKRVGINKPNI